MIEGEFKNRIEDKSWFSHWADADKVIGLDVLLPLIEEARKEFPLKRDTAIYDKDATISLHLEWSERVLEWYVKWLGIGESS